MTNPRWVNRPEGSNWGDFGPDDEKGRMNLLTPEVVLKGVAEVKEGLSFCLSMPLDMPGGNSVNPKRFPPVLHPTKQDGADYYNFIWDRHSRPGSTDVSADDLVVLHTQYSAQWDSLAHFGQLFDADNDGVAEAYYYNGWKAGVDVPDPHANGGDGRPVVKTPRLGIEKMAESCVQGRGVMIDLHGHFGDERVAVNYAMLREVMDKDGVEVEEGDMVLIHTGWDDMILSMNGEPDAKKLHFSCAVLDGWDNAMIQWISDSGLTILVSDNMAVENTNYPGHPEDDNCRLPIHRHCLFKIGVHLGEIWYLSELKKALKERGRSRFLLTAPPLRLPGSVGSPATPIATDLTGRPSMSGDAPRSGPTRLDANKVDMSQFGLHRKEYQTATTGPLSGVRVVDMSRLVCGNLLTFNLGDMGAEVIKIEPAGKGDPLRAWGDGGIEAQWKVYARNKKSMALNLRDPKALDIVRQLIAGAQILVEGFRPGRLEEMGLAPDDLWKINPKLVITRISGYGQSGPYKERPGFGSVVESLSGFASRNGFADREPVLPPMALADSVAGLQGAFATVVALREAEKDDGKGQVVDLALLEPLYGIMGPEALVYQLTGRSRPRTGSSSTTASPRNVYETKDGKFIGMSASIQTMAERVFRMIGREDLLSREGFRTNMERVHNREEVDRLVGGWIKTQTLAEVAKAFEEQNITASAIYEQADILRDPHFREREVIIELPDDELGTVPMQNVSPRLSGTPGTIRTPAPKRGEHSRALLEGLGYGADDIEQLKEKGVVEG